MSGRKKRAAVDEPDVVDAEGDLITEPVVEPVFDPELDLVPVDATPDEAAVEGAPEDAEGASGRRTGRLVVGAVTALVVAVGAVWAAGALGGSDEQGLPGSVTEPTVVLSTLEAGGIDCSGQAVSGMVATCSATVAVRVFDTPGEAESYVVTLVKDPLTSSAVGWVRDGNVVVASPLNAARSIANALGEGAQIY